MTGTSKWSPGFCICCLLAATTLFVNCRKAGVEPVALEREDMCAYCRMAISEKRYAAELIDSEGQASKFDDIACMANFLKNKRDSMKVAAYFVIDFEAKEWTNAENAYYVHSSELTTPMNGGIIAFKEEAKAREALARYHGRLLRFGDIFDQ